MRLRPHQYADGLQRRARAVYASPAGPRDAHAEGIIVSYVDAPTFVIVTGEGRTVPWRADLTDVGERVDDGTYFRHANARRLRDGRDTVRPELRRDGLPLVTVGMSVLEVYERVVAHGLNPERVSIEYAGCGSHEIELSEDVRPRAEIEEELEESRLREERRADRLRSQAEREAVAEAVDADPNRGW